MERTTVLETIVRYRRRYSRGPRCYCSAARRVHHPLTHEEEGNHTIEKDGKLSLHDCEGKCSPEDHSPISRMDNACLGCI